MPKEKWIETYHLNVEEQEDIDQKVIYELNETQRKMVIAGGVINSLAGLFVVFVLHHKIKTTVLIGWFLSLIFINAINIAFSLYYRYRKISPEQLKPWRRTYHCILILLAMAWGSIGVLFVSNNIEYQLYIITFLQIALVAFSFGTVTDFTATIISVASLLFPYVSYRMYAAFFSGFTLGYDPNLNITFGITLSILGIFLLVTSYIGYQVIKKFFRLNFVNLALNEKLENMNNFLEQRVTERTVELKDSLEKVTYQATHDLLTELPNRRLLLEYIESSIDLSNKTQQMFAVVCFSLNEIEKIYDGLGHMAGDEVITTIAERFKEKFMKLEDSISAGTQYNVTLSRKDEFIILIQPLPELKSVEHKISALFSILEEPIFSENKIIKLTASAGASLYPRDGRDIKSLLMNADAAMLLAKQNGGNSLIIYERGINADISRQLEMMGYLHSAVRNKEFRLEYQPFVNLKNGRICGAEALLRWNSPFLGEISPQDFIPLAEANGLIVPLGEWVFRTACIQVKYWHELGFDSLKVAVNISAKQLQQKSILERIMDILKETQLKPEFIELELTESEAFRAEAIPILKQFKEMGFSLSIDDFGTGYSGLTNLKLLSINKLKVDKSFVQDVCVNRNSQAIISNIINLAEKINVEVIAEGVETEEQLMLLKNYGCDMIQGYYFSPPLDPETFTDFFKNETQSFNDDGSKK